MNIVEEAKKRAIKNMDSLYNKKQDEKNDD